VKGRHFRAIAGTFFFATSLTLLLVRHIIVAAVFDKEEIAMHLMLIVAGLLLIDRATGLEVLKTGLKTVKKRLPLIGKRR